MKGSVDVAVYIQKPPQPPVVAPSYEKLSSMTNVIFCRDLRISSTIAQLTSLFYVAFYVILVHDDNDTINIPKMQIDDD